MTDNPYPHRTDPAVRMRFDEVVAQRREAHKVSEGPHCPCADLLATTEARVRAITLLARRWADGELDGDTAALLITRAALGVES